MLDRESESKYRIVAGSRDYADFLALLDLIRRQSADIRSPLPDGVIDTIETRKSLAAILSQVIDKVARIANTKGQPPASAGGAGQDF